MEELVSGHGTTGLLAGIVVMLALHAGIKLGSFVFDMIKKKSEVTDKQVEKLIGALAQNTDSMRQLDSRIREIEISLVDLRKTKLDLRRSFAALRYLSGNKWDEVRAKMMSENN